MQVTGRVGSYGFDRVTMNFGGIAATEGADGDDVITVEKVDPEEWKTKVGVGGSVLRCKNLNNAATIHVKLQPQSPANDAWNAIYKADKKGANGAGVAPIEIKHLDGATVHFGEQAFIVQSPKDQFGQQMGDREWVFFVGNLESDFGGF